MISHRTTAAEYLNAGAVNSVIGLHSFYDDQVFFTKNGELGVVLSYSGVDFEGQDATTLDSVSRRFQSAVRMFNENYKLFQYLFRTSNPPIEHSTYPEGIVGDTARSRVEWFGKKSKDLYTLEGYLVITLQAWTASSGLSATLARLKSNPWKSIPTLFSARAETRVLHSDLRTARDLLINSVQSFVIANDDLFQPVVLNKHEAFRFFRRLLNPDPQHYRDAGLPEDDLLDYHAANSTIETHRGYLRLADHYASVLTLKQLPSTTFANTLSDLLTVPSDAILCTQFQRVSNAAATKEIRSRQRHYHNTKTSMMAAMSTEPTQPGQVLENSANTALVDDLGEGLKEIELKSNYFGYYTYTAVLYNTNWERLSAAVAEAQKVFATKDAEAIKETYNILNAYLAIIPGNNAFNHRRLMVTADNHADLSFLFTLHCGEPRNAHLESEYLSLFETVQRTPYYLNLHYKDVAHTLITGATGSGKSFLLNFLLTSLQKYNPFTCIFDLGGSYQYLTKLLHGTYSKVSIDSGAFTVNPFSLEPTPENLEFLYSFVRVLLESDNADALASDDSKDIYNGLQSLYQLQPHLRRLQTLGIILPLHLSSRLERWIQGGQYGSLFDNAEDTLTISQFQCFDFEGMDKYPLLIEPLLFYILHRANARIYNQANASQFKAFVMDEAWRFFQNDTIKQYLREALKTWRKRNAAMILATQSSDDLRQSGILDVILESTPTRIFLANPGMNSDSYREAFHLNATQADLIRNLIPKRQLFVVTPDRSKVLSLEVDPRSYWCYTNSPTDNAKRDALIARHGLSHALDLLTSQATR
jgi:type IV secretion system protein VirB4